MSTTGAIYRVERLADGTAGAGVGCALGLLERWRHRRAAMDPFNPSSVALIRGPELNAIKDPAQTSDDQVAASAGQDEVLGGYGADRPTGASSGDVRMRSTAALIPKRRSGSHLSMTLGYSMTKAAPCWARTMTCFLAASEMAYRTARRATTT